MQINTIYIENNLSTMGRMLDGFVDLTVTSPPYDGIRTYNGYSFEFEKTARELYRITKEGGVVVWIVGDSTEDGCESGTSFRQALYFMECGFNLHDTMIYKRNARFPAGYKSNRYTQVFEFMFVFSKGIPKTANLLKDKINNSFGTTSGNKERLMGGNILDRGRATVNPIGYRENIWYYMSGAGHSTKDEIAFKHPAIFPEKLAGDHILSWSNEGDLVYDCFGGSGTTAKMAHILKRNWIMSEESLIYVEEIARPRLEPYLQQLTFF